MPTPLVSIVMPVYNGGAYLVDAVASMIEQDMRDWEMICVNDGSSDSSGAILDQFADLDSRIRVEHQSNSGIVAALNRGCALARGPLICRMDCDDISLPKRLRGQAQFMREHPNCSVVGGSILEIDQDGDRLGLCRLAKDHDSIVDNLLNRRTGHFHPTTLIRKSALEAAGGYRQEYQWIEDHDLWLRLSEHGQLSNLPQAVLCYRQHAGSVCWQRSNQQRELMNTLLTEAYRLRNRSVPVHVLHNQTVQRSQAGPGKWARAAAKGGFPSTAWKHLRQLHQSSANRSYKARMTTETLVRIGLSLPALLAQSPKVPTFPAWQNQISTTPDNHLAAA